MRRFVISVAVVTITISATTYFINIVEVDFWEKIGLFFGTRSIVVRPSNDLVGTPWKSRTRGSDNAITSLPSEFITAIPFYE